MATPSMTLTTAGLTTNSVSTSSMNFTLAVAPNIGYNFIDASGNYTNSLNCGPIEIYSPLTAPCGIVSGDNALYVSDNNGNLTLLPGTGKGVSITGNISINSSPATPYGITSGVNSLYVSDNNGNLTLRPGSGQSVFIDGTLTIGGTNTIYGSGGQPSATQTVTITAGYYFNGNPPTGTGDSVYYGSTMNLNAGLVYIPQYTPFFNTNSSGGYWLYSGIGIFNTPDSQYYGYFNLNNSPGQSGDYFTNYISLGGGNPVPSYGLIVASRIACGGEIDCVSDTRIKNNIRLLDTNNALETIRKIQPKTFTYIDFSKNQYKLNYGFIAQDVDEVFPECVTKRFDYVPNIFTVGFVKDQNTISLLHKKTTEFTINKETSLKLKLLVNGKERLVTLNKIIDDETFTIVEPLDEEITDNKDNYILVYGEGVDDFHSIEKNAIFTLTTAAVKQLDMELQETKETVTKQQQQIDSLQQQIDSLQQQIDSLKELIANKLA